MIHETGESLVEHPGVFIIDELDARDWTQADLAYILGISQQQLNKILKGKGNITPEFALALGDAFDVSPEFFSNLQKLYDLSHARKPDIGVKKRASWASEFPIRKMIERGWIEDTDAGLLDAQMLRFFGKNTINEVPFVGDGAVYQHAAKKSDHSEITPSQYVWLYRVKKMAESFEAPLYSEDMLRNSLPELRQHMLAKADIGQIPHILRKCGIRFLLVESLPNTKIDGVCLWLGNQPVIGMTTLHDRMDNFCFVLRHEIEHVLNRDGQKESFSPIDCLDGNLRINANDISEQEVIANNAAAEFLIPREKLLSFYDRKAPFISERDVIAFAARHQIHPAIAVGQIQFLSENYGWLRKYLKGIRQYLCDWEYCDGWGQAAPTGL